MYKFYGNRGICNRHHCLGGMDAPAYSTSYVPHKGPGYPTDLDKSV